MTFEWDGSSRVARDAHRQLAVKRVSTGGPGDTRQVFEFHSDYAHFYFYARSMIEIEPGRWRPAGHWSLDGVPRKDPKGLHRLELQEDLRKAAFAAITEALRLFPEYDADAKQYVTVQEVLFDLRVL